MTLETSPQFYTSSHLLVDVRQIAAMEITGGTFSEYYIHLKGGGQPITVTRDSWFEIRGLWLRYCT